jgi:hypothetical protein
MHLRNLSPLMAHFVTAPRWQAIWNQCAGRREPHYLMRNSIAFRSQVTPWAQLSCASKPNAKDDRLYFVRCGTERYSLPSSSGMSIVRKGPAAAWSSQRREATSSMPLGS